MKFVLRMVAVCLLAYGMQSCTSQQQLYYPNRANEPALNHAGDAKLNLSFDNSGGGTESITANNHTAHIHKREINILSAEGAYSPINHLGIIGSYRSMYNSNSAGYRLHQEELGAGYYLPFGRSRHWLFEVYGGIGTGNMNAHNYYDTINNFRASVKANFNDLFLQPAVGYRTDHFSIMYGLKFLGRKFSNISLYENAYDTLGRNRYSFYQGFLNATYGLKNFQLNLQFLSSYRGSNNAPVIDGNEYAFENLFGNISMSIGLTVFITKDIFNFKKQ